MPTKRDKNSKHEEEIKKQAKEILDKFARALGKVKEIPDSYVERDEDRRKEGKGEGEKGNEDFQKRFFDNAKSMKGRCILAEKGGWK